MDTMLAARYLGPKRIETEVVPIPAITGDEALIHVDACGFCGSDMNIMAGTHPRAKAPLTVGHELSGHVMQIGNSNSGWQVGDHVTVYPLISCGVCYACTHGNPHVCRKLRLFGFDVDGGMAEFVKVPIAALVRLPENMPSTIGALIEPLAVAVHGVSRASMDGVGIAVVLGAGPIGLLTALVAQARGASHVIISDVLPSRLKLAESLGLHAMMAGAELLAEVMRLTNANGADVLFECAGHPSSAREMTSLVRSRATIINLGVFKKPVEVDMQAVNFKEIQILGSRVYERKDFHGAIDLAMQLPIDRIISHVFSLSEVALAFVKFQSSDSCKVLVTPK
ncbi:MAG TPA: alcohol dehydrogenase catalytic domain-containing protein [Terracidiphilus sp.]|jgi:2-desacetyl-2-hydroxyethyl bacteriochlorophyllide A dehydrogenase|nr:alcohol dehydrogenase catalytic domain-containing protein [Terracidiphilus sp.]